jgi:alpha-N-arabinofuranosidase
VLSPVKLFWLLCNIKHDDTTDHAFFPPFLSTVSLPRVLNMSTVLEHAMQVQAGQGNLPTKPSHPAKLTAVRLSMDPTRLVHPAEPPIDEKLYSGFLEHLGRCIYGGIVDNPKAPSPKELLISQEDGSGRTKGRAGFRKDVMGILAKDGELEVPMLRWPGGGCSRAYG